MIQAGPSYRIVSRWLDVADLDVVICPAVLAEVEEVLGRPRLQKRIEPELAQLYLATVRRIANLVDDPVSIVAATRDPDDDHLVALARQHRADYIVTGDPTSSNGTIKFRPPSPLQRSKTCSALDSAHQRNPSEPAIVIDDRPARFAT